MSARDEFDPNSSARWAWEEHMHIMEEAELDWVETNNDLDIEWYEEVWEEYEDDIPAETLLQHTTDWDEGE